MRVRVLQPLGMPDSAFTPQRSGPGVATPYGGVLPPRPGRRPAASTRLVATPMGGLTSKVAELLLCPDDGVGAVVLTNGFPLSVPHDLANMVLAHVLGLGSPETPQPLGGADHARGPSQHRSPWFDGAERVMTIQMVGLVAGALTTAAWVPQLVRTARTGSADELSWPYLLVFAAGVSTWVLYGVLSADVPVFLANLVSILLIGALVEVKSGARILRAVRLARAEPSTPVAAATGAPSRPHHGSADARPESPHGRSIPTKLERRTSTREAIVDAVIARYLTEPADYPSIESIAEQSGVAKPEVLHHFPTRLGLLQAVSARLHADSVERIGSPEGYADAPAFVRSLLLDGHDPTTRVHQQIDDQIRVASPGDSGGGSTRLLDALERLGVTERLLVIAPAVEMKARQVAFGLVNDAAVDAFLLELFDVDRLSPVDQVRQ